MEMNDSKYCKIYFALIAMVGISAALSWLGHGSWAIAAIFVVAGAKAFLVLSYYMGLTTEKAWVKWALFSAVACLAILFVALIPDIVGVVRKAGV